MKTYIYDLDMNLVAEGNRETLADHEDQFLAEGYIVSRQRLEPDAPRRIIFIDVGGNCLSADRAVISSKLESCQKQK
jgi:hypothetical protein